MARTFVVKLTHGKNDPERVAVALTVATTAVVSGVPVQLFLIHDAVELALPGALESLSVAHSPPLHEMLAQLLAADVPVYACTQCMLRRSIDESALRDGVRQGGAALLVAALAEDGAQSIDF